MITSLSIICALLLVVLNGFFVAAEFAMVRLRTTKIEILAKKGLSGVILAKIHKNLDSYLSACQLGITLASLGLGWIGEPAFAHFSKPILTPTVFKDSILVTDLMRVYQYGFGN